MTFWVYLHYLYLDCVCLDSDFHLDYYSHSHLDSHYDLYSDFDSGFVSMDYDDNYCFSSSSSCMWISHYLIIITRTSCMIVITPISIIVQGICIFIRSMSIITTIIISTTIFKFESGLA